MTTVAEIFETMDWGPAPESEKPALAWIEKYSGEFGHYFGLSEEEIEEIEERYWRGEDLEDV